MLRRTAIGLTAGLLGLTGCAHDGAWASLEEVLGWEKVRTPKPPKFAPASLQAAERVETLGRRIIAQNTFTGLDPLFHTIGVSESALFHQGTAQLYVSEGLVAKCKTEAELAAVLCTELGQMMAEQRAGRAVGRDDDPIRDVNAAPSQPREPQPKDGALPPPGDPVKLARELMRGAGFDPAELDRIEPLLKQSDRGAILRKQMAGTAPAPKWE